MAADASIGSTLALTLAQSAADTGTGLITHAVNLAQVQTANLPDGLYSVTGSLVILSSTGSGVGGAGFFGNFGNDGS